MNTRIFQTIILVAVVALLVSSCTAPAAQLPATQAPTTAAPTATAPPTETPIPPTSTPVPPTATPTATFTPEPTNTSTSTPTPEVKLAEQRYVIEGGGFSFQAPDAYNVQTTLYSATLIDPASMGGTVITLSGSPNETKLSLDDLQKEAKQPMEDTTSMGIKMSEITSTTVGGEEARMFDMTMTIMVPVTSTIVIATPKQGAQSFTGGLVEMDLSGILGELSVGENEQAEAGQPGAKDIFNAILASIQFQEIPASDYLPALDPAQCAVSKDKTYGLSKENPIVLYQYPGVSRVNDYFALIAGPKGQELQYALAGFESEAQGGETQKANQYSVTYKGLAQPVLFYIQETQPMTIADYKPPLAPKGFSCKKP